MRKNIFICLIVLLLTGCYNYEELNDIAIISAFSIDYSDGEYKVSYQIVNSNNNNNSNGFEQASFVVYDSPAVSLEESARKATLITSKRLYASHLKVLVLSEEVAKNHLANVVDFIYRNPDVRNEFFVLISKDSNPRDVLEVITPLVNLSSEDIANSLLNSDNILGMNEIVKFSDLLNKYLNPKMEITIPSLEIIGNKNGGEDTENLKTSNYNANVRISTMSVFKNNKFRGYLSEKESLSYSFIIGNLKKTIIRYNCDDSNYAIADLTDVKSSLDAKRDGKIVLNIRGRGAIAEVNCKLDLTKPKVIEKMNNDLNKSIEKMIKTSFKDIMEKYDSDIYGIEDLYYKKNNKYYNKIKDNWDEYFRNIKLEVNSDVNLFAKGNGLGGIYEMED